MTRDRAGDDVPLTGEASPKRWNARTHGQTVGAIISDIIANHVAAAATNGTPSGATACACIGHATFQSKLEMSPCVPVFPTAIAASRYWFMSAVWPAMR